MSKAQELTEILNWLLLVIIAAVRLFQEGYAQKI